MLQAMELTEGWAHPWGVCTQLLELQKEVRGPDHICAQTMFMEVVPGHFS